MTALNVVITEVLCGDVLKKGLAGADNLLLQALSVGMGCKGNQDACVSDSLQTLCKLCGVPKKRHQ